MKIEEGFYFQKRMAMQIIRLCMMLVLVMVSISMASAAEIDSPKATSNIVYLQRDNGVEAIQLPENVTQADKARMQKNCFCTEIVCIRKVR